MDIYEKFFTEKRKELSKETGYRIKTGEFYKGIEIIITYNTRCSSTLQFFRQIY